MVVEENTHGLYRCEAMFGNWGPKNGTTDFLHFDRQTLDFGKPIEISWEGKTLFEGRIFALEGNFPDAKAPEITILAEDVLQDLRMTRRTRTFTDVSDADVVRKLAADWEAWAQRANVDRWPGPRLTDWGDAARAK